MKTENLKEAIAEAKRFLKRAEDLNKKVSKESAYIYGGYPKESGSVKRASMDLTRSLAKLRNDKG